MQAQRENGDAFWLRKQGPSFPTSELSTHWDMRFRRCATVFVSICRGSGYASWHMRTGRGSALRCVGHRLPCCTLTWRKTAEQAHLLFSVQMNKHFLGWEFSESSKGLYQTFAVGVLISHMFVDTRHMTRHTSYDTSSVSKQVNNYLCTFSENSGR